jgi:hypothetical protein
MNLFANEALPNMPEERNIKRTYGANYGCNITRTYGANYGGNGNAEDFALFNHN